MENKNRETNERIEASNQERKHISRYESIDDGAIGIILNFFLKSKYKMIRWFGITTLIIGVVVIIAIKIMTLLVIYQDLISKRDKHAQVLSQADMSLDNAFAELEQKIARDGSINFRKHVDSRTCKNVAIVLFKKRVTVTLILDRKVILRILSSYQKTVGPKWKKGYFGHKTLKSLKDRTTVHEKKVALASPKILEMAGYPYLSKHLTS